jgi:glutaredoxin
VTGGRVLRCDNGGMSAMFRRRSRDPGERLVTLIGKPGCHLCDDAQSVIEKVCGELGVPWEKKDITQDEELHRAYWEQIPVVLVDGAQHTFWRVDEARLRKALTQM